MDEELAYEIGRAFPKVLEGLEGTPVGEQRIAVGRDMRHTAPDMAERYARGIADEGADVLDVGMVGTEMLYWTVGSRGLDGGLMCTASHNPKAYTGAKLVRAGALPLSGDEGIHDIRRAIEAGLGEPDGGGSAQDVDVSADFHAAALAFIDPAKVAPLKVVVDGGNGMAGPMVGPLLERLGIELVTTYWEPDGHFPDHEPNPLLEENRRFIDDTWRFVDGDFHPAILAEHLLAKDGGDDAAILYDIRASRAVADVVAR